MKPKAAGGLRRHVEVGTVTPVMRVYAVDWRYHGTTVCTCNIHYGYLPYHMVRTIAIAMAIAIAIEEYQWY
jgi:hypothetical protein